MNSEVKGKQKQAVNPEKDYLYLFLKSFFQTVN